MRILIAAIGRMKAGPERELFERYAERFAKAGGALGLDFSGTREWPESRGAGTAERRREEAGLIGAAAPPGAVLVCLDETGRLLSSDGFAADLAARRDAGARDLVIAIGGPDGFDPALRDRAGLVLSLGRMTFPHQIARILLAEQLYRAATILAGHPYHRA